VPLVSAAFFVSFQQYYPQDLPAYSISAAGFLWKERLAAASKIQGLTFLF
jgi:hypothetical protein